MKLYLLKLDYINLIKKKIKHSFYQVFFQELERQAKSHGLPISDFNWQGLSLNNNMPYNSYNANIDPSLDHNLDNKIDHTLDHNLDQLEHNQPPSVTDIMSPIFTDQIRKVSRIFLH